MCIPNSSYIFNVNIALVEVSYNKLKRGRTFLHLGKWQVKGTESFTHCGMSFQRTSTSVNKGGINKHRSNAQNKHLFKVWPGEISRVQLQGQTRQPQH